MTYELGYALDQVRPVAGAYDQFLYCCEAVGFVDIRKQYTQLVAGRIAETHCGEPTQQGAFARHAFTATLPSPLLGPLCSSFHQRHCRLLQGFA